MNNVVRNTSGKHEFIQTDIGDSKQRFYAGGRVQFGPADNSDPWVLTDIWTITQIFSSGQIEVVMEDAVEQVIDLTTTDVRVFEVPDEIRSEEMSTEHIAPFNIADDYGYADEDYYWNYYQASAAAQLFCDENEVDCQLQNAYHNDVEYFEYEAPEEEDEGEPEEEDDDPGYNPMMDRLEDRY